MAHGAESALAYAERKCRECDGELSEQLDKLKKLEDKLMRLQGQDQTEQVQAELAKTEAAIARKEEYIKSTRDLLTSLTDEKLLLRREASTSAAAAAPPGDGFSFANGEAFLQQLVDEKLDITAATARLKAYIEGHQILNSRGADTAKLMSPWLNFTTLAQKSAADSDSASEKDHAVDVDSECFAADSLDADAEPKLTLKCHGHFTRYQEAGGRAAFNEGETFDSPMKAISPTIAAAHETHSDGATQFLVSGNFEKANTCSNAAQNAIKRAKQTVNMSNVTGVNFISFLSPSDELEHMSPPVDDDVAILTDDVMLLCPPVDDDGAILTKDVRLLCMYLRQFSYNIVLQTLLFNVRVHESTLQVFFKLSVTILVSALKLDGTVRNGQSTKVVVEVPIQDDDVIEGDDKRPRTCVYIGKLDVLYTLPYNEDIEVAGVNMELKKGTLGYISQLNQIALELMGLAMRHVQGRSPSLLSLSEQKIFVFGILSNSIDGIAITHVGAAKDSKTSDGVPEQKFHLALSAPENGGVFALVAQALFKCAQLRKKCLEDNRPPADGSGADNVNPSSDAPDDATKPGSSSMDKKDQPPPPPPSQPHKHQTRLNSRSSDNQNTLHMSNASRGLSGDQVQSAKATSARKGPMDITNSRKISEMHSLKSTGANKGLLDSINPQMTSSSTQNEVDVSVPEASLFWPSSSVKVVNVNIKRFIRSLE